MKIPRCSARSSGAALGWAAVVASVLVCAQSTADVGELCSLPDQSSSPGGGSAALVQIGRSDVVAFHVAPVAKEEHDTAAATSAVASRGIVMSCPVNHASYGNGDWKPRNLFKGFETTVRILRMLGCELPIYNVIYEDEMFEAHSVCQDLSQEFGSGVSCLSMEKKRAGYGFSKVFAVEAAPVNQVMFIDCDAFFVKDPTYLFEDGNFTKTGALFWADIGGNFGSEPGRIEAALSLIPQERHVYREEWWFQQGYDSGLLLIDKAASQRPFQSLMDLITTSDMKLRFMLKQLSFGDKDLWHVAWLMTGPLCNAEACSLMPYASMSGTCYKENGLFRMSSQVKMDSAGEVIALHQIWPVGDAFKGGPKVPPSEVLSINLVGRKRPEVHHASEALSADAVARKRPKMPESEWIEDLYTGVHDGKTKCDDLKLEFGPEALAPAPRMVQDLVTAVTACWHETDAQCSVELSH